MDSGNIKRLNLGCGSFKKEGYINVDCYDYLNPDVTHDLNKFPYPFDEGTFDLIEADHVLEHLNDPFGAMRELRRILKVGGRLIIKVPHFSRGLTHPEHKRGFDVSFPYYFKPSFKGGYTGVELDCRKVRLTWFSQAYLKKTVLSPVAYYLGYAFGKVIDLLANLSPFICSRLWCFIVGGFEEVEFRFIRNK